MIPVTCAADIFKHYVKVNILIYLFGIEYFYVIINLLLVV